jgi:YfiR/HmsC-like
MIQFVLKDNKVRFEVNLTAAEKAGLTLSSQLLKVATEVRRAGPGGDVKP